MIYLDTSALVAYYVPEPLSDIAQERLLAASAVMVSELAQIEFFSALALRQRLGHLSLSDAQRVATLFASHLAQGLYISLHLSSAVYQQAQMYIRRFDLAVKAPDALHLATAAFAQAPLVTADRQLARNAELLDIPCELLSP